MVDEKVQIKEVIGAYIKEEFIDSGDQASFTFDTPLVSSRIMDSISTLQLVDFLEKEFAIEFKPHEVDQDNLNTVKLIADFVSRKKEM